MVKTKINKYLKQIEMFKNSATLSGCLKLIKEYICVQQWSNNTGEQRLIEQCNVIIYTLLQDRYINAAQSEATSGHKPFLTGFSEFAGKY